MAGGPDLILGLILDDWRKQFAKDPYGTWIKLKDEKDAYAVSTRQAIFDELRSKDKKLLP